MYLFTLLFFPRSSLNKKPEKTGKEGLNKEQMIQSKKYVEKMDNTYAEQCRDYREEISKQEQLKSHMPLKHQA